MCYLEALAATLKLIINRYHRGVLFFSFILWCAKMLEKLRRRKRTTHRCDTGGYLEANSLRSTNLFHLLAPKSKLSTLYMLYIVMVISKKNFNPI